MMKILKQQHIEKRVIHVYLHWDSFTPISWKIGILKTLVKEHISSAQRPDCWKKTGSY